MNPNKSDYYRFFGRPEVEIDLGTTEVPVCENTDASKATLKAIYSLDPVTRLPTGDIAMFLSDKTSPEVKNYILANLMVDTSAQAVGKLPDGLDEDTAFALERRPDESLNVWRNRVNNFMVANVENYNAGLEALKKSNATTE